MAIISDSVSFLLQHSASIVLLLVIVHFTRNYLKSGVSSVPGPFLASLSNFWRFIDVAHGHAEASLYRLHQKYGDYVRLGPNVVSVWDLDALRIIYGINKGYQKVGDQLDYYFARNIFTPLTFQVGRLNFIMCNNN
jgi:hypothetical protein